MTKIVIHTDYGGFGLSRAAVLWLRERGHEAALNEVLFGERPPDYEGEEEWSGYLSHILRSDPLLVELVETMGHEFATGESPSLLTVVEIPDDVQWHIDENDSGWEWVAENHRVWGACSPIEGEWLTS